MNIYIPEVERKVCEEFLKLYEPYAFQGTAEFQKSSLKPKAERRCRFCKNAQPDTTFEKKAHIIPNLLGNRHYLWDEECDTCNELFSKFETNLAYFMGIDRTLYDIKGGDKAPVFSSQDANVEARRFNENFMFIHRNDLEKGFEFDTEAGKFDINVDRRPFIPAYVYNAFLKIALSILPESDVPEYSAAYRYLLDRNDYGALTGPRRIIITKINYGYPDPHAALYRRITSDTRYPLLLLALYVQNFMFQIAFPLHEDELCGSPRDIIVPYAPYVDVTENIPEPIIVQRREEDLHGTEPVRDKDKYLYMTFDPEVLKNLASVQLPTDFLDQLMGKKKPPNPEVD